MSDLRAGTSIPEPTSERDIAKIDANLVLAFAFMVFNKIGPETRLMNKLTIGIAESCLFPAAEPMLRI